MILGSDEMPKKKEEKTIVEKIYDYSLEELMETGFGRYSKEIIQERALPDVRDGLKPVQRRILYAMFIAHFTHDKPYRKSAKAVGDIMGNFHPHGDSSIYGALIHMSQKWKMRETLIDIHGNNGSIDGDGPAAMRYTEARLSKIAEEMLKSIPKNTVEMTYNFDDTELEPTVLPASFPNLLVNGSTGISAGYATNIPTHNICEVIDATIKRIESPNCRLETIMEIMPGPDFPTGGVIEGKEGLIEAYTKGKGKVILKADAKIETNGSKKQIVISSIPYDVLKEQLLKKIIDIKIDKKVEGINDVIDESDANNLAKIIIDLKKDANEKLVLNYLLKNTDLQINYNFNMVAIVNRRPKLVGILDILDAFIAHQKEVILRRTKFDLEHNQKRFHIIEGLIKAISILDEVIKTIRSSKNKADAIENLCQKYEFTFEQSKAIVELQLYRLTNTDIIDLQEEMNKLTKEMYILEQILNNEDALKHVMKNELKYIKKEYGNERRTIIKDEVTEIKIDLNSMIPKEKVIVLVTNEGYIKRVSNKAYLANNEQMGMKPGDYIKNIYDLTTKDNILFFTNLGNYLFIPVHKIPETKWKELGKHINNIVNLQPDEKIVSSCLYESDKEIVTITKLGMIKRSKMLDYLATRISKPMLAMKLKEQDEVLSSVVAKENIFVCSKNGYYCYFPKIEIPLVGVRGSGVKAMNLKDDEVISLITIDDFDYLSIFTNQNTAKRIKKSEITLTHRAKRGNPIIKKVKSNPHTIKFISSEKNFMLEIGEKTLKLKATDIPIMDPSSVGSGLGKRTVNNIYNEPTLEKLTEKEVVEEQVSFDINDFKL